MGFYFPQQSDEIYQVKGRMILNYICMVNNILMLTKYHISGICSITEVVALLSC